MKQCYARVTPVLEEVAVVHLGSGTLILTELAFHFPPHRTIHWRAWLFPPLNGALGRFGPTRVLPLSIRDGQLFPASIRRILPWGFDFFVGSHDHVLTSAPKPVIRQALTLWL